MPLRMELQQLRHFIAAAEERNITRAAQKIFLTQSALSRQIKALEEEIGQCLLERRAHSIRLTPVGEALLPEARELLQHADRVIEAARSAGRSLRLRIGYAPSLAGGMLPAAVGKFTLSYPGTRMELFDLSTAEMLEGLEAARLDVAITVGHEKAARGLCWLPLIRAPWRIAVSLGHPLARRAKVTPADVAREPLLIFCRRDYPEYWAALAGWLREHGQKPRVAGEYDGVDSLTAAVESGQGVALVAHRKGRLVPRRVRLRPVSPAPEPLCIAVGHRSERKDDGALQLLIQELRAAAKEFL